MQIKLAYPLIITSRLLAGVKIGDACLSVELIGTEDNKIVVRYFIDGPDVPSGTYSGDDLHLSVSHDDDASSLTREAIRVLLSFMSADADSYARNLVRATEPVDGYPWGVEMGAWLYLHSTDIEILACELEPAEDDVREREIAEDN